MGPEKDDTFEEFWHFYVAEHSRPVTRWLHFLGTTAGILITVVAIAVQWWPGLAVSLLVGYTTAFSSHLLFEHNRPASFKRPVWAFFCDWRMWGLMLVGRMPPGVERVPSHSR